MTRSRRPDDWGRDLEGARASERALAEALSDHPSVHSLADHTDAFDLLDFSFTFGQERLFVDIKEKRQPYSLGINGLWPTVDSSNLFILDETVYRRIVWQGGGGYLVVRDHPRETLGAVRALGADAWAKASIPALGTEGGQWVPQRKDSVEHQRCGSRHRTLLG